jgi:transglutaminase/protease-like cytokinesis protein 3
MPKKPDDAWDKAKVNNEWRYIDATWGAGYVDMKTNKFVKRLNYNYCLTPETKFSLNHIEEKLPKSEVSKKRTQFSKSPFYHRYYIGSDIEMISPSTAKVSAKGEKTIEIKIKDFPESQVIQPPINQTVFYGCINSFTF